MILFSHYISTYLVRKTIEETSRQKNVLAQNIENEIDSINSIMNNIYYNTIKKYDIQDKNFKTILANEITSNSETIYGLALYDTDGKYDPDKIVDVAKYEDTGEITGKDETGLSFRLGDLYSWGKLISESMTDYDGPGAN